MSTAPGQSAIDAYWTERAPAYDAYQQRPDRLDADRDAWAAIWADALPPAPAAVLDVGTGTGHAAFVLAGLGHDVTGIDRAAGMLRLARARAAGHPDPPRFEHGDAVAPDFPPGSFDAVTGRYLMWTLREPVLAVRAWTRLLRPGGVVAMADSTWFADGLGGLYDDAARRSLPLAEARSIDATAQTLAEGGLVDVQVVPLERVLELDRRHGVAPGHEVRLQFLVTGRRG